jgi:hypothetical protein
MYDLLRYRIALGAKSNTRNPALIRALFGMDIS